MNDREFAVDHTPYVLEGLAIYRDAAEQQSGHNLEPWQYQDSGTGHSISSRCARCGWILNITFGADYDLTQFPASAQASASTAMTAPCPNPGLSVPKGHAVLEDMEVERDPSMVEQ